MDLKDWLSAVYVGIHNQNYSQVSNLLIEIFTGLPINDQIYSRVCQLRWYETSDDINVD